MLLERLTTPERGIYNIDFATLDVADRFGQSNSEQLVEYWILNDYFVLKQDISIPTPLDVEVVNATPIDVNVIGSEGISGTSKVLTYYTGIEAGNPSGSTDNVKYIDLYTGIILTLRQTITYNSSNNVLTITNV